MCSAANSQTLLSLLYAEVPDKVLDHFHEYRKRSLPKHRQSHRTNYDCSLDNVHKVDTSFVCEAGNTLPRRHPSKWHLHIVR